jgi:hypothetical protein
MQAILRSEAEPGARAFLAAPPTGRMESFDNAWALLTQLRMLGALAVILCMPPPAVLVGKEPPDAMPCETPSASVQTVPAYSPKREAWPVVPPAACRHQLCPTAPCRPFRALLPRFSH